jgi:putative membrane protein
MNTTTKLPLLLLTIYLVLFVVLAVNPLDRPTWWAENLTVWVLLAGMVILYWRKIRFSNLSYVLMSVLLYMHTIGGHFTFEKVPFDWVTKLFGFDRNNYDRFAHVTVGFYAYPIAEWLTRKKLTASRFLQYTYPLFVIATAAVAYEWIEWAYASTSDPEAGANYLGSQGDVWDAQKDMLCDTTGAAFALVLFGLFGERNAAKG